MNTSHPWQLVAPWYRIDSVGRLGHNRHSGPILQKYAGTDFAKLLTEEPQASLKFTSEDFVTRPFFDPDQVVTPDTRADGEPFKLFLVIHGRQYKVMVELHCDLPGFPNANRDEVCEAGFVIRRRVPRIPDKISADLALNLQERQRLKQQILQAKASSTGSAAHGITFQVKQANEVITAEPPNAEPYRSETPPTGLMRRVRGKSEEFTELYRQSRVAKLEQQLADNLTAFKTLVTTHNIRTELQGWVPGGEATLGDWIDVDAYPETIEELVVPLYPLIADPTKADHSAAGRTIWFGVVTTSSNDTNTASEPRFSDNVLYEAQCFVRRHKPNCPKLNNQSDCSGEIVWSQPSEPYQLASPYDLDGGSHKPINIKFPDLNALRDQVLSSPPGRGVAARVSTPPGSAMNFDTNALGMPVANNAPSNAQEEICFFFFLIFFYRRFLPLQTVPAHCHADSAALVSALFKIVHSALHRVGCWIGR